MSDRSLIFWTSQVGNLLSGHCLKASRDADPGMRGNGAPGAALRELSAYVGSLSNEDPRLYAFEQASVVFGSPDRFTPSPRQRLLLETVGVELPSPGAQRLFDELLAAGIGDAVEKLGASVAAARAGQESSEARLLEAEKRIEKRADVDLGAARDEIEMLTNEVERLREIVSWREQNLLNRAKQTKATRAAKGKVTA